MQTHTLAIIRGEGFAIPTGRGCGLLVGPVFEGLQFIIDGTDPVTLIMADDPELSLELAEGRSMAVGTGVIAWSFGSKENLCPFIFGADGTLSPAQDASVCLGVDNGAVILVAKADKERRLVFERPGEKSPLLTAAEDSLFVTRYLLEYSRCY